MAEKRKGRGGFQVGAVLTLAGAHLVHDIYTALLAPLLPLLIPKLGLSLFLAGSLTVFMQIPSLANPWLGALTDRARLARPVVIIAPAVTAVGMCLVGLAPSFWSLAALLLVVGVSVAALHVAAPPLLADVAGDRLGRGTSFFMVGGELARTLGPLVAVAMVAAYGLEGIWRLIPFGIAASLFLWWRLGRPTTSATGREAPAGLLATWRHMRRVLLGVGGVLVARAFMAAALTSFLPVFLHGEGSSLLFASVSLSVFELAGAFGALSAGTVSDWVGRRAVLLAAVVLSPPLMLLFLWAEGSALLPVLLALGVVTLATTPVLMAVMLESSGGSRAAANGTFMMMTFASRSLIALPVGALGDALGLRATFALCAVAAAIGIPFVFLIPKRAASSSD